MEGDNWDLHAVVRSCMNASITTTTSSTTITTTTNTTTTTTSKNGSLVTDVSVLPTGFPSFILKREEQDDVPTQNLSETWKFKVEELQELYKPFLHKSEPSLVFQNTPSPTTSFYGSSSFDVLRNNDRSLLFKPLQRPKPSHASSAVVSSSSASTSQPSRSKRKKSQVKRVCQVPAESLSSDIWAWRKYGQKPIKGSPYPRGYYRCSSSKGCLARKQVERDRSESEMFIVTYTAEHNHPPPTHRNSLAGSTRQKPIAPTSDASTIGGDNSALSPLIKPSCSSPASSAEEEGLPQSINSGSREDIENTIADDEEGEVEWSDNDMAPSDNFFEGIEGFIGNDSEDCFLDQFPANFSLSWTTNSTAAAASNS